MFKAVRDIAIGDLIIQAGDVVEKPSTRMIDLGLVVEVQGEAVQEKVEKPREKKEKAEKPVKVEEKTEEKTEEVQTPKEELLTEQSSDVTVEKTEE